MAYMNKERAKTIRDTLKKTFPEFKFSVRISNHTGISVRILEGPVKFADSDFSQLNEYYPDKYQHSDIFRKMIEIINFENYDNSNTMIDHFDVGYYVAITQGSWNKPYKLTDKRMGKVTKPKKEKKSKFTKEFIIELLEKNNQAVERALVVLYELQTTDEQAHGTTIKRNGQGFSLVHAIIGTNMALQIKAGRALTPKQLAVWRKKDKYGNMRIARYWKQLQLAAENREKSTNH